MRKDKIKDDEEPVINFPDETPGGSGHLKKSNEDSLKKKSSGAESGLKKSNGDAKVKESDSVNDRVES